MQTLRKSNLDDFTCYTINWIAYGDANRRTWSADNMFEGNNSLGKMSVVFPHVQFYGTKAVSVSELIKKVQLRLDCSFLDTFHTSFLTSRFYSF